MCFRVDADACVRACVRACVLAYVRAYVRAYVCACVRLRACFLSVVAQSAKVSSKDKKLKANRLAATVAATKGYQRTMRPVVLAPSTTTTGTGGGNSVPLAHLVAGS